MGIHELRHTFITICSCLHLVKAPIYRHISQSGNGNAVGKMYHKKFYKPTHTWYNAVMSLDQRLMLIFKWLCVVAIFMVIVMPLQIIWFCFWPITRSFLKRQADKAGVALDVDLWFPINWYGTNAKKVLEGSIL